MIGLAAVGSILLGISIISTLVKRGEMGCLGYTLIIVLVLVLLISLGIAALIALT